MAQPPGFLESARSGGVAQMEAVGFWPPTEKPSICLISPLLHKRAYRRRVVGRIGIGRVLCYGPTFGDEGPYRRRHLHCQLHGPGGVRRHGAVFVADNLPGSLIWRRRTSAQSRRARDANGIKRRAFRYLCRQHFLIGIVGSEVPDGEGIGEQTALWNRLGRGVEPQEKVGARRCEGVNVASSDGPFAVVT